MCDNNDNQLSLVAKMGTMHPAETSLKLCKPIKCSHFSIRLLLSRSPPKKWTNYLSKSSAGNSAQSTKGVKIAKYVFLLVLIPMEGE
jgi:hypothetical protein